MEKEKVGLRLATLRTKKNVSAREMSLSIGQNENYINHIETGGALPSLSGLFYICDYLGITPCEFFDTDSTNPSRLKKITEYMKKLDDKQLEIVENLIKNMAEK
ncbi:MAG: helix-turn-helix transcriptional regulator [Clostridia bacterium]|nr:helix-turn-helix transcriptional regulator [Clostridia bacterium]MBQ7897761.1 helix-turn-helix transcriptional regulator [Clostridia bacterium]